jgi:thioredoxin-related protein
MMMAPMAGAQSLAPARDLRADGREAAKLAVPLIVLVSLEGCPHCEAVRRSHLLPLQRDGDGQPTPVIRQVELRGENSLVDFNGDTTTHSAFARRYRASIAPVVLFLDGAGKLVSAPLVGAMIPDFYGAYFDSALKEARNRVRQAEAIGPAGVNP